MKIYNLKGGPVFGGLTVSFFVLESHLLRLIALPLITFYTAFYQLNFTRFLMGSGIVFYSANLPLIPNTVIKS